MLDALALSYLTDNPDGVRHLRGQVVLTPNGAELAKTLHIAADQVEESPDERTVELAELTAAVVSSGGDVGGIPARSCW